MTTVPATRTAQSRSLIQLRRNANLSANSAKFFFDVSLIRHFRDKAPGLPVDGNTLAGPEILKA